MAQTSQQQRKRKASDSLSSTGKKSKVKDEEKPLRFYWDSQHPEFQMLRPQMLELYTSLKDPDVGAEFCQEATSSLLIKALQHEDWLQRKLMKFAAHPCQNVEAANKRITNLLARVRRTCGSMKFAVSSEQLEGMQLIWPEQADAGESYKTVVFTDDEEMNDDNEEDDWGNDDDDEEGEGEGDGDDDEEDEEIEGKEEEKVSSSSSSSSSTSSSSSSSSCQEEKKESEKALPRTRLSNKKQKEPAEPKVKKEKPGTAENPINLQKEPDKKPSNVSKGKKLGK